MTNSLQTRLWQLISKPAPEPETTQRRQLPNRHQRQPGSKRLVTEQRADKAFKASGELQAWLHEVDEKDPEFAERKIVLENLNERRSLYEAIGGNDEWRRQKSPYRVLHKGNIGIFHTLNLSHRNQFVQPEYYKQSNEDMPAHIQKSQKIIDEAMTQLKTLPAEQLDAKTYPYRHDAWYRGTSLWDKTSSLREELTNKIDSKKSNIQDYETAQAHNDAQGALAQPNLLHLKSLPPNLSRIIGSLKCIKLASLESLGKSLKLVVGDVNLKKSGIKALPEPFVVMGNLTLEGCKDLEFLRNLHVHGDLEFNDPGSDTFKHIYENVRVDGFAKFKNATGLETIANDFNGGYSFRAEGAVKLRTFPEKIYTWQKGSDARRTINIAKTAIPLEEKYRLKAWAEANPEVADVLVAALPDLPDSRNFSTLQEAVSSWREQEVAFHEAFAESGFPVAPLEDFNFTDDSLKTPGCTPKELTQRKEALHVLLRNMASSAEMRSPYGRERVTANVVRLLHLLNTKAPSMWREEALGIVLEAPGGCQDRATRVTNQLETSFRVHEAMQAKEQGPALRTVAVSMLRREMVEKAVIKKLQALKAAGTYADDQEVATRYETRLADKYDLPIPFRRTIYEGCCAKHLVSDAELDAVGETLAAITPDCPEIAAYLQQWAPWQRLDRMQQLAQGSKVEFADLDVASVKSPRNSQCPITHEPLTNLAQPVTVAGRERKVYEYRDLRRWWEQSGVAPDTRQRFSWSDVRRAVPSDRKTVRFAV